MFESILEKLVMKLAGKYILNLSKESMKVSIWKGEVIVEDVEINPQFLIEMKLPFELKFSKIKYLNLYIPWKNLSNESVKINLDGLYLILEPKYNYKSNILKEFVNETNNLLDYKNNVLKNFKINILEELQKENNDKEEETGYFQKILEKVIDNLEISIKNIHLRVENNFDKENFSFGITLENLNLYTCDENNEKIIINRNEKKEKLELKKYMELKNFYIYWNTKPLIKLLEEDNSNDYILTRLLLLIKKDNIEEEEDLLNKFEYILNFSTYGKIIQNQKIKDTINKNIPIFDLLIDLKETIIKINKNQLNQIIKFTVKIIKYFNKKEEDELKLKLLLLRPNKKINEENDEEKRKILCKNWFKYFIRINYYLRKDYKNIASLYIISKLINKEIKDKLYNIFVEINEKYSGNLKKYENEKNENFLFYKKYILGTNILIINHIFKEKIIENYLIEKTKTGFFNIFNRSPTNITKEEKENLMNYLDSSDNKIDYPDDYYFFKIKIIQNILKIYIIDNNEKLEIFSNNFQILFSKKNKGFSSSINLESFFIYLKKYDKKDNLVRFIKILTSSEKRDELISFNKESESKINFIKINFDKHPLNKPGLNFFIDIKVKKLTFIYNNLLLNFIFKIANLEKIDDNIEMKKDIINETQKKLIIAKDFSNKKIQEFTFYEKKMIIDIFIDSPIIILPIESKNISNSESFLIFPGDFYISSNNFDNVKENSIYNLFNFKLENMNIQYYNKFQDFIKYKDPNKLLMEKTYFNIYLSLIKNVFSKINIKDTKCIINSELGELNLNIDDELLDLITKIVSLFEIKDSKSNLLEISKSILLTNNNEYNGYLSYLKINENKYNSKIYFKINNESLKFYNDDNIDDDNQILNINLNNKIKISEVKLKNNLFVLKIKENNNKLKLKSKKFVILEKIKSMILDKHSFFKSIIKSTLKISSVLNMIKKEKIITKKEKIDKIKESLINIRPKNFPKNIFELNFNFKKLNWNLIDNKLNLKLIAIASNFVFILKNDENKFNLEFKLKDIDIKEINIENNKEDFYLSYLLTSNFNNSLYNIINKKNKNISNNIINIKINLFERFSPEYLENYIEKIIDINLGKIYINIIPNKINKLLKILSNLNFSPKYNIDEDKENELIFEIEKNNDGKYDNLEEEIITNLLININIDSIGIIFITNIKKLPLLKMDVKNLKIDINIKQGSVIVKSNLNDYQIYDLTNYPNTLINQDFKKIKKRKIFGHIKSQNKPLFNLEYKLFDPKYYNWDSKRTSSFLNIFISDSKIIYNQQLVFRIIDYIFNQFMPTFYNLINNIDKENKLKESKYIRELQKELALEKIIYSYFMNLNINLKNTNIVFKLKEDELYFLIFNVKEISITNELIKNNDRIIKFNNPDIYYKEINSTNYNINFKDINIKTKIRDINKDIMFPCNIDVNVNMMNNIDEYKIFFDYINYFKASYIYNLDNIELMKEYLNNKNNIIIIDESMKIKIKIDYLIMKLSNFEYQLILKASNDCITFNDGFDKEFIELKIIEKIRSKEEIQPMEIDIYIKKIAAIIYENETLTKILWDENYRIPKSKIYFSNIFLNILMTNSTELKINSHSIWGYYLLLMENNNILEKGFLEDLSIKNFSEINNKKEIIDLFLKDFKNDDEKNFKLNENFFHLYYKMNNERGFEVDINFDKITLLLQTDIILSLTDILEEFEEIKLTKYNIPISDNNFLMNLNLKINNIKFVINSIDYKKCLTINSKFILKVNFLKSLKIEEVKKLFFTLFKNDYKNKNIQEINLISIIDLNIIDLELFISDFDLIVNNLDGYDKRNIIYPLSFEVNYNLFNPIAKENNIYIFYDYSKIEVLFDEITVKFAIQDIDIILEIINYQLNLIDKNNEDNNIEKKENFNKEEEKKDIFNLINKKQTSLIIKFKNNIKISIINDIENIFSPTINLIWKDIYSTNFGSLENTLMIKFFLNSNYYNSELNNWEPFIETTQILINFVNLNLNNLSLSKVFIKIKNKNDKNEENILNLNITNNLIKKIFFLKNKYYKFLKKFNNKDIIKKDKDLNVKKLKHLFQNYVYKFKKKSLMNKKNLVVTYKFYNDTGYDVLVSKFIQKTWFNLTETDKIKKNKKMLEQIIVKKNEYTYIKFLENFDKNLKKRNDNFEFKSIKIEIIHPEFKIKNLKFIKIDDNIEKKIKLKGNQAILSKFNLIYISENIQELKIIKLCSEIILYNKLNIDLIIIIKHPFNIIEIELNKKSKQAIPFDYINYKFNVFIKNNISKNIFEKKYSFLNFIYSKENNYKAVNLQSSEKIKNITIRSLKIKNILTNLYFSNVLMIKNYLPTLIKIELSNNVKKKNCTYLKGNEKIKFDDINLKENIFIQIEFNNYKTKEPILLFSKGELVKINKIILEDKNNGFTSINIKNISSKSMIFRLFIYSEMVVINESNIGLNFFEKNKNKEKKLYYPVENSIYLLNNPKSKIYIEKSSTKNYFNSKELVKLEGIGKNYFHIKNNSFKNIKINKKNRIKRIKNIYNSKDNFIELLYDLSIISLDKINYLNSKILNIKPSTIFFNDSPYTIYLNKNDKFTEKVILKNSRNPIYFFKNNKVKPFKISIITKKLNIFEQYDYVLFNEIGNNMNYLFNKDKSKYKILKTDIILKNNIIFIYCNIWKKSTNNIKIFNSIKDYELKIYQKNFKNIYFKKVKYLEQIDLIWISNIYPKIIEVELINLVNKKSTKLFVNPYNTKLCFKNSNLENKLIKIFISNYLTKDNKIMEFNINKKSRTLFKKKKLKNQFIGNIFIKNLGISIIGKSEGIRKEYFYIYLKNIFGYFDFNEIQNIYQFKIKFLQIDSHFTKLTNFPIILTPNKYKNINNNNYKSFINIYIIQNNINNKDIISLKKFLIDICSLSINIDMELIFGLIELTNQYKKSFEINELIETHLHYFFNIGLLHKPFYLWESLKREKTEWINIEDFQIQTMKFKISFKLNDKLDELSISNLEILNLFLNTVGFTWININEAPIRIKGINIKNLFETKDNLTNLIIDNSIQNLKNQIYKIFGSLDLIGNPVYFFRNVGMGVSKFFKKPIKGFIKGPLEGLKGFSEGTYGIFKITLASSLNSISKISGSIVSGLTILTFDDDYLKKRKKLNNKESKNIIIGLGKSVQNLSYGLFYGITGLIKEPIRGAEKKGSIGFFYGLFKGFSGVLTKPLVGTIDIISLTTQGLQNTMWYFDDKPNKNLIRINRIFYERNNLIKEYSKEDSIIINKIKNNNNLQNNHFVKKFKLIKSRNFFYIVITFENIIFLNKKYEIQIFIGIKEIENIKLLKNKIRLNYFYENFTLKMDEINIYTELEYLIELYETINYVRSYFITFEGFN